jgi:hypothetical protein
MTSSLPDPAVTFAPLLAEIRALYGPGPIPLHRPVFAGPERRWLVDCIDANFVSSVGARVTEFEERVAAFALLRYPRFRFRPSQADALQVDLWLGGINHPRDAGSYRYNTGEEAIRSFGGTAGHNTIQFDDRVKQRVSFL